MRAAEAILATLVCLGALLLELRGGGGPAAAGAAPDLLLAAAVALATHPAGTAIAAGLGLARDAIAGGPCGAFMVGFLLTAIVARAALGAARRRGMFATGLLVLAGVFVAYGAAALPLLLTDRASLLPLLRGLPRLALASALFSPVVTVPLGAAELLSSTRGRVDLSRSVS